MRHWHVSLRRPDLIVLMAGIILYILHLCAPYSFYTNYDGGAHMAYIKFIASHFWFPQPKECYECHQPFLYYLVNGIVYAAGESIGLPDPRMGIRLLALVIYVAFIGVGMRLLRSQLSSSSAYYFALALLVFWPGGVMKASVPGNDIAEALMQLGCVYYLVIWWQTMRPAALGATLLWNGLAMAVKQSGIILSGIIATTVCCRWALSAFPIRPSLFNRKVILASVFIAVIALVTLGRTYYYYHIVENIPDAPLINPRITHVDYHMKLLQDRWLYYVTFDLRGFLDQPFFNPRDPATDRYYVWNSLFKSALFGEFILKAPRTAMALDILELGMALYMVATGAAALWRKEFDTALLPFLCFMDWQLSMLIAARALYPTANNEDFRFIYASVAIMAILYGRAMIWHEKHRNVLCLWLGRGLASLFVFSSILLIVFHDAYI